MLVLISNQSGIGRGLVTAEEAEQVHSQVIASLGAAQGIELTGAYYCPHAPRKSASAEARAGDAAAGSQRVTYRPGKFVHDWR